MQKFETGDTVSLDVTYDRDDLLYVAAKISKLVLGVWTLIDTVPMVHDLNNTYRCTYLIPSAGLYGVNKSSYLDSGHATKDGRPSGSDGFTAVTPAEPASSSAGVSSVDVIGYVIDEPIIGTILED